jgi:hypothetical protein
MSQCDRRPLLTLTSAFALIALVTARRDQMNPPFRAIAVTLLAGVIAASMTACSEDLPTGTADKPGAGGAQTDVIAQAVPANDDFDNATVITSLPFTNTISTIDATQALDDPVPTCAAGGQGPTVWYAFTPSKNMMIQANTFGSDYDTDLLVYTGTRGNLTELACNDDAAGFQSSVTIGLARGQTYFFMVGAFGSGPGGTLVFNMAVAPKSTRVQHLRGKGAHAFFSSSDPCVSTVVEVVGVQGKDKTAAGGPSATPFASVLVDQYDFCTDTQLSFILGSTGDGLALQVGTRLTDASLQVTIPAIDFVSGTEVSVDVNVDWTGTGQLVTTSQRFREKTPGGLVIFQFKGTRRDATASGTVSVGGVNFTPEPTTQDTYIFDSKDSQLTVERTTT